jgi:hypothetical protein
MQNAFAYYSRFQSARGGLKTLPPLARSVVAIFAIPGIALAVLSIALLLVSIFLLLLLTVPVYRVLQAVFGVRLPQDNAVAVENPTFSSLFGFPPIGKDSDEPTGRKQVTAKVVE